MISKLDTYQGVLGPFRAAHLLRRTTYAISKEQITKYAKLNAAQAAELLFDFPSLYNEEPLDPKNGQAFVDMYRAKPFKRWRNGGSKSGKLLRYIIGWWTYEAQKDLSIRSKMVFFLHNCFTIKFDESNEVHPNHLYDHIKLLIKYAKGNYKTLALEMVVDNLMLDFLDNFSNSKDNPNENFAREFLELFTIGKGPQIAEGNYTTFTELDVRIASRLLTGFVKGPKLLDGSEACANVVFKTSPCRGETELTQHDISDKQFSSSFGETLIKGAKTEKNMWRELEDFVSMIFNQDATAHNIVRKMYRYFVSTQITKQIEETIITPLAKQLKEQEYTLEPILKQLIKSKHFYESDVSASDGSSTIIGGMIKSPLELVLGTLQFFKVSLPKPDAELKMYYVKWFREGLFDKIFPSMGFHIFSPQDVAGYPAYYQAPNYDKNWLNSSSIVGRYKLIETLLRIKVSGDDYGLVRLDTVEFIRENIKKPASAKSLVSELLGFLFPLPVTINRLNYFLYDILLDGNTKESWTSEWQKYSSGGDPDTIKKLLDRLIKAIVNAPEYQVM